MNKLGQRVSVNSIYASLNRPRRCTYPIKKLISILLTSEIPCVHVDDTTLWVIMLITYNH